MDEAAEEVVTPRMIRPVQWHRMSAIGWDEVERAVWPMLVVVAAIGRQHMFEVASAEDEHSVEAVWADRADRAFGVGVRVRRLDRRADHLMPSVRKTSSKAWLNLVSRSWMRAGPAQQRLGLNREPAQGDPRQ